MRACRARWLTRDNARAALSNAPTNSQQIQHVDQTGRRIEVQTAGAGARIVAAVQAKGIGFVVAAIWTGGRVLERQLKNRKCAPRFCPICRDNQEAP